jgi:hypothetical protein
MGVYDRQIALATRLIKAKGEVCTWRKAAAPVVANPSMPWIKTDGAPTDATVSILWVSSSSNPFAALTAGSEIESGGQEGIMAKQSFTPDLKDVIVTGDGTILQLTKLTPVAPNGTPIIWRVLTSK